MATTTIPELPEQTALEGTNYLIVQDDSDTKKMLVSRLTTLTDNLVTNGGGVDTIIQMGQAAYDALGIKDPTTLYIITGP
jgi:hypothetical protein